MVSTANQKALVWNLTMSENSRNGPIEHVLHAHTRAITDINFSAHHPDVLATCAVDGDVHCWDLRRPSKPAMTFADWFAGATQVKWNRQDSHILASSHDRWLRVWDDRKGAYPLRSIEAHDSKIYGVDWNRTRASALVTCSLDRSIKFWDIDKEEDTPDRTIRTDYPVWRARHTPFGWGILAMPHDKPGNIYMYQRTLTDGVTADCAAPPVHVFAGHGNEVVNEALWRARGTITNEGQDEREFQLVSWGTDNILRLQHVDDETLKSVGHIRGSKVRSKLNVTRKGATYKSFREVENLTVESKTTVGSGLRPRSSGMKFKPSVINAGMKHRQFQGSSFSGSVKGRLSEMNERSATWWMSGVTFNKRRGGAAAAGGRSRRMSLLSPNFSNDNDWDTPESLKDEILRVESKFNKVTFEKLDMNKRTLSVTLNGPWGAEETPVFMRAEIEFPSQYPEEQAPTFKFGKTSMIPEETFEKLCLGVEQIASDLAAKKNGCLESALRFLLGERSLVESLASLGDSQDLDDLNDSSSDDDDDSRFQASTSLVLSQDLTSSATADTLSAVPHNAAPLPRSCGARFSGNGKLVCFFPPKEEKINSLLGAGVSRARDRTKGDHAFETFGRLREGSPVATSRVLSPRGEDTDNSDLSDGSDESYTSSGSDSGSSVFPTNAYRFNWPSGVRESTGTMKRSTNRSQRSSAAGTGTGTVASKGRLLKPKNMIILQDVKDLLPAKQVLAEEYAILGDGLDVCTHNAKVAARHGYRDLSDIWQYAGLLLQNEVPLEFLDKGRVKEPILVVAQKMRNNRPSDSDSDSGLDVSFDQIPRARRLSSRVKWGYSPLAKGFIDDLFNHFESIADVQMLAMLSCVFNEPENVGASHAGLHLDQPHTPLTMKTPAFSLDYFPTDAVAWAARHDTPSASAATTPKDSLTPIRLSGSFGSTTGVWDTDAASMRHVAGLTPPIKYGRGSSDLSTHSPLSTSPEGTRSIRRSNSAGLASSFANFARPFSITASSPPGRKRPSPVESVLGNLPSGVTWGPVTSIMPVVREKPHGGESAEEDEDAVPPKAKRLLRATGIKPILHNQNAFDGEGCLSVSLLPARSPQQYSGYRKAYAELLYRWNCNLSRVEILKFDGLSSIPYPAETLNPPVVTAGSIPGPVSDSPIILGNKQIMPASIAPPMRDSTNTGLDMAGYCLTCESRLQPLPPSSHAHGGSIGRCEKCNNSKHGPLSIQRHLLCVICTIPAAGLFVSCLSCGCVSHEDCLAAYYETDEPSCAGGCPDCNCQEHAVDGVVESWDVMMGAIRSGHGVDGGQSGDEWTADHRRPSSARLSVRSLAVGEGWGEGDKAEWEGVPSVAAAASQGLGVGSGMATLRSGLGHVRIMARKSTSGLRKEASNSF